jgi:hypothetical protein
MRQVQRGQQSSAVRDTLESLVTVGFISHFSWGMRSELSRNAPHASANQVGTQDSRGNRSRRHPSVTVQERGTRWLALLIPERFCCNCGFAAATNLHATYRPCRWAGSPLAPSTYCFKYASGSRGSTRPSRHATPQFRDEPSGIRRASADSEGAGCQRTGFRFSRLPPSAVQTRIDGDGKTGIQIHGPLQHERPFAFIASFHARTVTRVYRTGHWSEVLFGWSKGLLRPKTHGPFGPPGLIELAFLDASTLRRFDPSMDSGSEVNRGAGSPSRARPRDKLRAGSKD